MNKYCILTRTGKYVAEATSLDVANDVVLADRNREKASGLVVALMTDNPFELGKWLNSALLLPHEERMALTHALADVAHGHEIFRLVNEKPRDLATSYCLVSCFVTTSRKYIGAQLIVQMV